MSVWTPAMRARQSALASKLWQRRVRANPKSHKLARARALRDLTEQELGALAGVSSRTISEIENNRCVPSHFTQERLSRVLALPPSELFA